MNKPSRESLFLLLVTAGLYSIIYLSVNWYSFNYQTQNKFFFDWELNIPFVESFILVYFSAYISFIPVFLLFKYEDHLKISKALLSSAVFGAAIFLLYPTVCGYERDLNNVIYFKGLYQFLWNQDNPVTLMPSFHVQMSTIFLIPIIQKVRKRSWQIFNSTWLVLICFSIVLVHQHHLADIFTGFFLGLIPVKYFRVGE